MQYILKRIFQSPPCAFLLSSKQSSHYKQCSSSDVMKYIWNRLAPLAPLEVNRRGGNEFLLDKIYVTRIFCDKIGSVSFFFGLAWCSEHFTPAYRGSPPPAVFHDKSQMTNMKNTAGKSARVDGEWDLDFDDGEGGALMVRWFRDWEFKTVMNGMVMMVRKY